ncbi:MAG: tetratricopeptide repeat protein [Deltaproteobacteria bacterium]|nr:tetratricopeptide repeat protein [Deltaproteobacteria bacterium]
MRIILTLAFCVFAVGCGPSVRDLEKGQRETQGDIGDIRSLQAEQTAAIAQLQSDIRAINGRIDEIAYLAKGRTEQLEEKLSQVSSRVPPPPGVPEDLLNEDEEAIARISSGAAEQFKTGLRQLRTGDFEGAKSSFSSFKDKNPGTAFTDNALFWIGVSNDSLGQHDRAVVAYSEVFQKYPGEDRVAVALFRLGDSFLKLGSREDAALSYQMIVDDYPKSVYAKLAQEKLKTLKTGKKATPAKKK